MSSLFLLSFLVGASAVLPWIAHRRARGSLAFLLVVFGAFFLVALLCGGLLGMRPTMASDSFWLWAYLLTAATVSSAFALMGDEEDIGPMAASLLAVGFASGVWFLNTSAMLHSDDYRNLIQVTEREYDGKIELIAQDRVQLIDAHRAAIRAGELLGSDKGLGSQFGLGTFSLMIVKDRPTWVAPLVNRRTVPSLMGHETPGYVTIDATDDRLARLVTDRPIRIHGPGDAMLNAVDRVLWFKGHSGTYTTDYTLEIDDEGRPFWVVSTYEQTIGTNGYKVTGTILVDAGTGETKRLSVEETPKWVDLIQPDWIVADNLENNGLYVDGWINARFTGEGIVIPTKGDLSIVHMVDGTSRFYTGLQTQTSQNGGTSGFALIDTRTGKADVYLLKDGGISEATAEGVMEGIYQAEGYNATAPRLYMVDGKATLVSLLTDKGGNPKAVGMVSQETRAIFGAGATLEEARRNYVASWNRQQGGALAASGDASEVTFQVVRIGLETADKGTNAIIAAYVGPATVSPRLFVVPVSRFRDAAVTREGDTVRVRYANSGAAESVALDFENVSAFPSRK